MEFLVELLELFLLRFGWGEDVGFGVTEFHGASGFGDVVEVGDELIVFFLRDGIIFVVVAASTADGES